MGRSDLSDRSLSRREFLSRVAGGTAAIALAGTLRAAAPSRAAAPTGATRKPNIIVVECDSMDGRAMGCMGLAAASTPNFDRLAARGALFRNTYTNSPQCCPSRASMWSGKHTHLCEGWSNNKGLEPKDPTFQNDLEAAGYRFVTYGKLDYRSGGHAGDKLSIWTRSAGIEIPQKGRPKGVVQEKPTGKSLSERQKVTQCIDWLKKEAPKNNAPFFLYCGLGTPHPPYVTSREWYDKIAPAKVTVPPYEEKLHPVMEYMSLTKSTLGKFSEQEIREIRRVYYGMIADLDDNVGRLAKAMDEAGLADSTYFIFISDHGDMNMTHRQYLKNALYEGSARVPMIIAGPSVKAGTQVEALVSLLDLYPTFMDVAGLPHPAWLNGHSLMPEMRGEKSGRPDWVFSQYHSNMAETGIFMLRRGDWKYIAYAGYEPQLFNLKDDPEEMRNLAAARPEIVKDMDARLRAICDYDAVDAKVKAYDKKCFTEYRAEIGSEAVRKELARNYKGWGPEQDRQIHRWLGEPEDMPPIPPSTASSKEPAPQKKKKKKAKDTADE